MLFSITDRQLQSMRKVYTNDNAGIDIKSVLGTLAEVRITLSDGSMYPYPGKINFTDNAVTGTTDSLRVRGEFPNPNGLLTLGQTVSVSLQSKTPTPHIVVPQAAIQNDISGKYVLVVGDNGSVERRMVNVGALLSGGRQVILDNLTDGERIIVDGVQKVRPNTPVNAMTQDQFNQMQQQQAQQAGQPAANGGGK